MTLSPDDLSFLAQAYGWDVFTFVTLHEGENTTYRLTTSAGQVAVRRYRSGRYTPTEVNAELEWLAALKDAVPVVPALYTRSGARCVVGPDETSEVYAAFPYIVGDEPDPPTPSDFEQLGKLSRQLHGAAANILETRPGSWAGYQRPTYDLQTVVGSLEALLQTPLLDRACKQRCVVLAERLGELYETCKPAEGFVHADLHFGNVLVSGDIWGDIWTLLDFDECGFGFSAFDLGTVRFHALARGQDEGWEAFLAGYGNPLPTALELQLGTAMKIFYTLGKLPFRLDVPEVRNNASGLLQKYLRMIEQLVRS